MFKLSSIAVVPIVVLLALPAGALASEAEQQPRGPLAPAQTPSELFREGLAEYDAEHFPRAIELFTKAYDQTKAPGLLFNIAQAWRLLGECNKAVTTYLKFVAADPSSPDAVRAQDWVNKLVPCRQRDTQVAPPPQDIEPRRPVVAPAPAPAPPTIGVVPPPQVQSKPHGERRSLIVGILAGTSVTCLGTGAYAAWRARDYSDRTTALYAKGGVFGDAAAATEQGGRRARNEAVVLLSAALLTAAAATVIHFFWRGGS